MIGEYHLKLEAQTLIKNRNSWHHFLVLFLVLGRKDGAAVRALASQQCGPGSNPGVNAICGCWVCCWFSPLLREIFSKHSAGFPSPQKPTFSNSISTRNRIDKEPLCKSLYIFIYYHIYLLLNWSRLDFHRSVGHPREETVRGRSAGSFNEQRLIIEPTSDLLSKSYYEHYSQISDYWVM